MKSLQTKVLKASLCLFLPKKPLNPNASLELDGLEKITDYQSPWIQKPLLEPILISVLICILVESGLHYDIVLEIVFSDRI